MIITNILQKMLKQDLALHILEIDRPVPEGKYPKVIWLMRDGLGGEIMKECVRLRAKKQKGQKSVSPKKT